MATQPFVRLVLVLIIGILSATGIMEGDLLRAKSLFYWAVGLIVTSIIVLFLQGARRRSVPVLMVCFGLGLLVTSYKEYRYWDTLQNLEEKPYTYGLLRISTIGQKRTSTYRYEAELTGMRSAHRWEKAAAKVLVSVSSKTPELPQPGDYLLVRWSAFRRPQAPLNPGEFDYETYLRRRGIHWTVYLPEHSVILLPPPNGPDINEWPLRLSTTMDRVLNGTLKNSESYGLIKAMLLGRRDDLGSDMLNAFITSGTVHVLAVSGLHVGLLFWLLSFLLGGIKKIRGGGFLYIGLIIFILGLYAMLTGLSPSVLRASLMCIIFGLADVLRRQQYGLNTLSISAFFLLLLDPLSLYSVSFQLSYAAVAGILLFYPLFKDSLNFKSKILRWIGQVSLVGFAAQLATFPLTIYYFHQFPTYFWLVNPLVLAITSLLLYSTLGLIIAGSVYTGIVTTGLAYLVNGLAALMNTFVHFPAHLPYFLLDRLYLSIPEVSLLFIVILLLYGILKTRRYSYMKVAAGTCLMFSSLSLGSQLADAFTPETWVHSIPKHTVISFLRGQTAHLITDADFVHDSSANAYRLSNFLVSRGILETKYYVLPSGKQPSPLLFRDSTRQIAIDPTSSSPAMNYIIFRGKRYPRDIAEYTRGSTTYLLSPELGFRTRQQWLRQLTQKGIPVLDLSESGAFKL